MVKRTYQIDGFDFSTLEEFYEIISRTLIPNADWGCNLDAFNDILRGGFGTPDDGFILHWKNSSVSRERLSYDETVRQLESTLLKCHPSNRTDVQAQIHEARQRTGTTVYDWLTGIIQVHCPGGEEETDGVELILD